MLHILCSKEFITMAGQNYPDGKIPFGLCVDDVVNSVCVLMTDDNMKLILQDIEKYAYNNLVHNQDRQSEDRLQDGSNDNFPCKPASSGCGL